MLDDAARASGEWAADTPGLEGGHTITRIEAATLVGTRPRVVGCNARLPVHGQVVRDAVVRLHTDTGLVGWGWCAAKADEARGLLGRKLREVFALPGGAAEPFLRFDLPLWDLAGRAVGRPVHALLGDAGVNPVPVYDGSIYIDEIDPETGADRGLQPVLDAVQMGLDAGHRAFKAKIGRGYRWMERRAGMARDVEVLHAVRGMLGGGEKLLIDANNGYTPEEARELMRRAGGCDIHWFEEPFPEDVEACVALKRFLKEGGCATRIADGEGSERGDAAFTEIVRAGGVDVVQFDLRAYGLTRWLRYLPVIREMGAWFAPHNWGSHLSGYYIAQMGRGCERFAMAEMDTAHMPAVSAEGYALVDGMLQVPDAPGFGLELDPHLFADALREPEAWVVG